LFAIALGVDGGGALAVAVVFVGGGVAFGLADAQGQALIVKAVGGAPTPGVGHMAGMVLGGHSKR